MGEFFHPFSLCIIQPLFYPVNYDFIYSLGLLVSLGVGRSGISVRNSKVAVVFPKGLAIKLKAIVRDEGARNSEVCNDVSPDEFLCIHVPDVG